MGAERYHIPVRVQAEIQSMGRRIKEQKVLLGRV